MGPIAKNRQKNEPKTRKVKKIANAKTSNVENYQSGRRGAVHGPSISPAKCHQEVMDHKQAGAEDTHPGLGKCTFKSASKKKGAKSHFIHAGLAQIDFKSGFTATATTCKLGLILYVLLGLTTTTTPPR